MQKESLLFFAFPSAKNFGEAKVTNKRVKCKSFCLFLSPHYSEAHRAAVFSHQSEELFEIIAIKVLSFE